MKFAYADPPYLGLAKSFYGDPTYDSIDAHAALINRLATEFPDGWALSMTSGNLFDILPLCPRTPRCRVMAWVKPFCSFKPNVAPAYAWEPIIVSGGRKPKKSERSGRDWVSASMATRRGLRGAKPDRFCWWLFAEVFHARHDDEFVDLFPGSGGVGRAWEAWRHQLELGISA